MNKIEQELFDLEELLMRNDDVADRSIYITIGSIANNVSKLESENAKLRELIKDMWRDIPKSEACAWDSSANTCTGYDSCIGECSYWYRMVKLGIEAK